MMREWTYRERVRLARIDGEIRFISAAANDEDGPDEVRLDALGRLIDLERHRIDLLGIGRNQ